MQNILPQKKGSEKGGGENAAQAVKSRENEVNTKERALPATEKKGVDGGKRERPFKGRSKGSLLKVRKTIRKLQQTKKKRDERSGVKGTCGN